MCLNCYPEQQSKKSFLRWLLSSKTSVFKDEERTKRTDGSSKLSFTSRSGHGRLPAMVPCYASPAESLQHHANPRFDMKLHHAWAYGLGLFHTVMAFCFSLSLNNTSSPVSIFSQHHAHSDIDPEPSLSLAGADPFGNQKVIQKQDIVALPGLLSKAFHQVY